MVKKSLREDSWRDDPRFRSLCKALLSCTTEKQMAEFLRDIGTLSELEAWCGRFLAAGMLKNNVPYRDIAKQTGLSTTTVTRIAGFLKNNTGYATALKKLHS